MSEKMNYDDNLKYNIFNLPAHHSNFNINLKHIYCQGKFVNFFKLS